MPGMPAAKLNDQIVGVCTHVLLIPAAGGAPVPTPTPMPFNGELTLNLSPNVLIEKLPAATVDSIATNLPPHIPTGGPFAVGTPTNQARIVRGSATVLINGKPAARATDTATTCSEVPAPAAVVASGTVFIGGS